MQKYIVTSLFILSMMIPSAAFAQFGKGSSRALLNTKRLEHAVRKAAAAPKIPRYMGIKVPVSNTLVTGGQIVLFPVISPTSQTPANYSFVKTMVPLEQWFKEIDVERSEIARMIAISWQRTPGEFPPGAKAFYQDQSVLARDLHQFYSGKGPLYRAPNGRQVKLYALPVNGILYQPAGYKMPVVLNSYEYFVVYDVEAGTGQLAKNTRALYSTFEEIAQ